MKDTLKTKKILTITIASFLVTFALYGILFLKIRSQNQEISTKANEVAVKTEQNKTIRATELSLEKNKDDLNNIDSYFVSSDGVVEFINTLDALGSKSNTKLTIGEVTTELDPRVKDDFKETLKFRVNATGSFEDVYYLLTLLESLPVRLRIEQVSLGLASASDKLLFSNASSTTKRVPSAGEEWKLDASVSVIKIR